MADTEQQGTFETREDAGKGGHGVFRLWMTALDLAAKEEEKWRERAQEAIKRFRDEEHRKNKGFNILYSSVQTQEPAIYNSTPIPDVRRRFGDDDPIGKVVAQIIERSLSHCIDDYDFDCTMGQVVHDSLLPGRGLAMVEYEPSVGDEVDYETVKTVHVQWDDFRRGPGKTWKDVSWAAIRYRITREEAIALNPEIGGTVNLDYVEKGAEGDKNEAPDVFKRLTVWKIWDKSRREIVYIAPSYKEGPFQTHEDSLNLKDFFPFPRPLYDIEDSGSLVPVVPYRMWKDQADELDRVTRRIHSLVNVLRWRGIRPAHIEELDRLKDADDGELIPSTSFDALAMTQGARPDQAIWLMPIDKLITVIRELVVQREAIKQVIFEITGLADIMRGETDPNETLGAQQIKAQWGSLRMQRRQRECQRFARDLLRIKAEIICEQFSTETLSLITGINLPTAEQKQAMQLQLQQAQATQQQPPQEAVQAMNAPTWEEVRQVMASDALRSYRVDIETDSTIQADNVRAQQNIASFIEGVAAFGQSFGPMVQTGDMPKDVAAALLTGFARNFKLGKQAEDALEKWGRMAQQPEQPKPDPEAVKAEAQLKIKAQEAQQDAEIEQQKAQADLQRKDQEAQAEARLAQVRAQAEIEVERMKAEAQIEVERMKADAQMRLDAERAKREEERADEEAKREGAEA